MIDRRWNAAARWLGLLAVTLWAATAAASSALAVDLDQLAQRSEVVVRGVVKSRESRWSGDGKRILTDVQIDVSEALKGSPARTVTVQQPGGVVGDVGQMVHGLASFEVGEEVVVFLERWGPQRFQVTGAAQGKFKVERSSDGTRALAVPDRAADLELLDESGKPTRSKLQPVELSELRARVKQATVPRSVK